MVRVMSLALVILLLGGGVVLAAGPPGVVPGAEAARQSGDLDTRQMDSVLSEANRTWAGYGPEVSLKDFLDLYRGGSDAKYAPRAILGGLWRYLSREVLANTGLLTKLVVLAIVAALLQSLQSAFDTEATGRLAYAVVYLVLIGLALSGFGLAVTSAKQAMDGMSGFMLAMLPVLLTVLAGLGGVTSAAIFHPIMITFVSTAATTMVSIVFPLIFLSAVLEIVSGLGESVKLTHLAGLLRQGATIVMSLTFTVFLGVVAFKGAAGAVADGLTMKTARFALGTFLPVVGKMFADATDLIFGSTILLKNALGLVGVAAIFFIAIFPLLKILSLVLIYQLAAALVQPAGAGQVAGMLGTMARALQMVFASVAVVALMFFVGVTVIVGAGNLAVMVR